MEGKPETDPTHKTSALAVTKIGVWRMFALTLSGIGLLSYAYSTAGGYVESAGSAAIYVGILGAVVVLLASIPILEYTRHVRFSGGYYGLAEIGLGKSAGKFTAINNYFYFLFWQSGLGPFIAMLTVVGYQIITGYTMPEWTFFLIVFLTPTFLFYGVIHNVSLTTRAVLIGALIQIVVVLVFAIFVIIRTPYNSVRFFNPLSGPNGFSSVALGASIAGFLSFIGYGAPIFYSEEDPHARKTVWKGIILGVFIAVAIGSLAIYSELAAVSNINAISSSPIPLLSAYAAYIGRYGLFFFLIINIPISIIAWIAAGGGQARLLWTISRDKLIKSRWLGELDPKTKVPKNAAIFNYILALIMNFSVAGVLLGIYGYNDNAMFYAAFAPFTAATVSWYIHHFIPDISLGAYFVKHKIKISLLRKIATGLLAPVFGVILFSYAFYAGIVSDEVEPYFAFVMLALLFAVAGAVWVYIKYRKKEFGESLTLDMEVEEDDS